MSIENPINSPPQRREVRARFFVVDDDANCRSAISDIIRSVSPDAEIYFADSGRVALWEIVQQTVEIVITDYYMPGMDGGTLSEKLREAGYRGQIILISGNPAVAPVAAESGANAFVFKMRMLEELPPKLKEAMHLYQSE